MRWRSALVACIVAALLGALAVVLPAAGAPATPAAALRAAKKALTAATRADRDSKRALTVAGRRGVTGPRGRAGRPGSPGTNGPAGPAGAAGSAGPGGATGDRGAAGARGPTGPAGDPRIGVIGSTHSKRTTDTPVPVPFDSNAGGPLTPVVGAGLTLNGTTDGGPLTVHPGTRIHAMATVGTLLQDSGTGHLQCQIDGSIAGDVITPVAMGRIYSVQVSEVAEQVTLDATVDAPAAPAGLTAPYPFRIFVACRRADGNAGSPAINVKFATLVAFTTAS